MNLYTYRQNQAKRIETLLDTILIQAEIMELKGNPKKNAKAIVVEASLEKEEARSPRYPYKTVR